MSHPEETSISKREKLSVVIGAGFLMATAAVGPSFLTQSATFTQELGGTFGFVILVAVLMSIVVQINVWRVIGVAQKRGQDIANQVLPGLGYLLIFLIAAGCLIFNIGNVAGVAMGLNVVFGIEMRLATVIGIILSVLLFLSKEAGKVMDKLTTVLGLGMILLVAYVVVTSHPPLDEAIMGTIHPSQIPFMAILTIVGGTVGGYHPFAGGHRLLDGKVSGLENLREIDKSASIGIVVTNIIRILLFLATLGAIAGGAVLDPNNPAADAFQITAGTVGYKFFGVVMLFASVSSVVGASYTSLTFLSTLSDKIEAHRSKLSIIFILISGLIFLLVGRPANLLVLTGALNGLVLPITMVIMLIASQRKDIMGDYRHPKWLLITGIIVTIFMAYSGIQSLSAIGSLLH